jgi:hypothetical protein
LLRSSSAAGLNCAGHLSGSGRSVAESAAHNVLHVHARTPRSKERPKGGLCAVNAQTIVWSSSHRTRAGSVEARHKASPETGRGQCQGFPADEITQMGFAGAQDYHVAGAGRASPCARLPAHRVNQGMILLRALERQFQSLLWRKARVRKAGGQGVGIRPAGGL